MPVPANETLTASYDAALLLQAEGVTKSFPGVKALSGMRFGLRKGEGLALVGENGDGKATAMKLSTGNHTCEAGQFRRAGRPLGAASWPSPGRAW